MATFPSIPSILSKLVAFVLFEGVRGHLIQVFTGGGGFNSSGKCRRCGLGGL